MLLRMISWVGAAAGFLAGGLFGVEEAGFGDSAFGFADFGLGFGASIGIAKLSRGSESSELAVLAVLAGCLSLAWLAWFGGLGGLGGFFGVSRFGIPDPTSTDPTRLDAVISGLLELGAGILGAGPLAGCLGSFGHPERPWHRSQILQSEAVVSPKYKRMVFCRHAFVRA
jgi:hypothetical protein